jgi:ubiquitin-conjugating enzyme E2 S
VIKCLLIEPNPESALNEEAGKLLLENYQEFSQRAALMTEIHAKPQQPASPANSIKKFKICKEKKKALKRL